VIESVAANGFTATPTGAIRRRKNIGVRPMSILLLRFVGVSLALQMGVWGESGFVSKDTGFAISAGQDFCQTRRHIHG
jgi:hypothetical protein